MTTQQLLADAQNADHIYGKYSPRAIAAWDAFREHVDYNKLEPRQEYWACYCNANPFAPGCKEYDV